MYWFIDIFVKVSLKLDNVKRAYIIIQINTLHDWEKIKHSDIFQRYN